MTVCVASNFRWAYPADETFPEGRIGPAIIADSDRMLTDEGLGIQYEGTLMKRVRFTDTIWGMVSGAVPAHSAVIRRLIDQLDKNTQYEPFEVANLFSHHLREFAADCAEALYLA